MSTQVGSWTATQVGEVAERLAQSMPEEVLAWALDAHAPAIALGTGLGAEGMVVLDHLARMGRVPRVFMLDTGRLPLETH
jgi:phosphoadenosine phosphosulfate reductase